MSTLKVNTISGVGSGGFTGSVASDGGAVTTDLQQGLVKCWSVLDGRSTPSFYDSFNASSISDQGTGDYRLVFTNGFSNKNYCGVAGHQHTVSDSGCNAPLQQSDGTHTTAQAKLQIFENGNAVDPEYHDTLIAGDLA